MDINKGLILAGDHYHDPNDSFEGIGTVLKNEGKPCYQWSVAFVRGEVVSQKLNKGNSHCISCFKEIVASVAAKLEKPISIIRVDGGYFSADILDWIIEKGYQIVTIERYKWIMSQKPKIDPDKWIEYNSDTKLYDLGRIKIISTTEAIFRAILVDIRQHPFGKKQLKKKHIRYAIIENLATELSASALYEFYHGRQTIESFFKESKNPFNSGKMPSQKFRANEAYLQFVAIVYNSYSWFKKNFFHTVLDWIEKLGVKRIVEIHAHNVLAWSAVAGGMIDHFPFEDGTCLKMEPIFGKLKELGYQGPVVLEIVQNTAQKVVDACLRAKEIICEIWEK